LALKAVGAGWRLVEDDPVLVWSDLNATDVR
jgi:hypothetical protein